MPDTIDYRRLVGELLNAAGGQGAGAGARFKAVTTPPNWVPGHGPGGLFSSPALERPLFSATILPITGVAARIPAVPTRYTNPLYGIITGVTATSGSEPSGACDDPPTAGLMKLCTMSLPLGRWSRQSRAVDIRDIGRLTNRGENTDFVVYGNPFAGPTGDNPAVPTPAVGDINGAVKLEMAKTIFELGAAWARDFALKTWTGTPTVNTAGYKEFWGLESLVNTGYRDAETGVACAAADSTVMSFGGANITTGGSATAQSIVNALTYMFRNLRFIASRANLGEVELVLAMRFTLFYELIQVWPISYQTYRSAGLVPTGATEFVDSGTLVEMRDAMLNGEYLLIDGKKVPVIIDDTIPETEGLAGGAFQSDIYMLPLSVMGGAVKTLYWEYLDFSGSDGAIAAAGDLAPAGSFSVSDSGRFLWHRKPPVNWCVQLLATTAPRLVLRTPYLAGRLQSVRYTPLGHERSWDPSSSYFKNGGGTAGSGPSYYSPTA